jgi:hypothetical protein
VNRAACHDFSAPGFAEDLLSRNHNGQAEESQIGIVLTFADCVGAFVQQEGSRSFESQCAKSQKQ